MWNLAGEILTVGLLVLGAFFVLLAAIGLVRMPDVFTRMSAATKATTLGNGAILLAVALAHSRWGVSERSLAIFLFLLLTAPIAAHMMGRAAFLIGTPLAPGTRVDERLTRESGEAI